MRRTLSLLSCLALFVAVSCRSADRAQTDDRAAQDTLGARAPAESIGSTAPALDDPTIVAIFDAANSWDIETGQLAAQKATSAEVRKLGQRFASDHTAIRQQGRDLAQKLAVTPTPPTNFPLAKDHEMAMEKLRSLSGAEFDRAFLEHEVAYHRAVIEAVTTTLLPAIGNPELKALVEKVAPAFQAHQVAAESLQKQVALR